jgi:hypothetical protein
MTKKKQHGGSRPGAGRPPVKDPKVRLFISIEESAVEAIGGTAIAKGTAEMAIRHQFAPTKEFLKKLEKSLVKSK